MNKISIIILNWNGIDDTVRCIESLKRIDYPNYEIIVIDNGSTDNSVSVLKKIKGIRLIVNKKNLGYSVGCNIGIKDAFKRKANYIFLLNNDTYVDKNILKELMKVMKKDNKIGIVGSKFYHYNSNRLWFAGGRISYIKGDSRHIGDKEEDNGQYDKVREIDYAPDGILIKKELLNEVGLFDPVYFGYYEEMDLCERAKKKGWKTYFAPKAKVWHRVSASSGKSSPFLIRLNVRNRLIFMKKNAKRIYWLIFPLFYYKDLILLILYKFLKGDKEAIKAALKGWKEALAYKPKIAL